MNFDTNFSNLHEFFSGFWFESNRFQPKLKFFSIPLFVILTEGKNLNINCLCQILPFGQNDKKGGYFDFKLFVL